MTDYLITNSAAILGGVEDASVPGTFDPAFASHAIRLDEADDPGLTLPPVNDVWVHADYYFDDHDTTTDGDGHFWMIAVPNAEIVMIDVLNGNKTIAYAGSTGVVPGITGPQVNAIPNARRFTLDARIETGAAVGGNVDGFRVTFYIDGGMLGQVSGICNVINGSPANRFGLGGADYLDGNGRVFVSNALVSDRDTRGRRFRILRPSGPGALATAVGGHAELGDGNPATFAYARAAGQAVTSTLTPGAAAPGTIGRLILTSQARASGPNPSPGRIAYRLRIGGTNHDAAPQAPTGTGIEPLSAEWTTNPATGQPWIWADLATLEIGFKGES